MWPCNLKVLVHKAVFTTLFSTHLWYKFVGDLPLYYVLLLAWLLFSITVIGNLCAGIRAYSLLLLIIIDHFQTKVLLILCCTRLKSFLSQCPTFYHSSDSHHMHWGTHHLKLSTYLETCCSVNWLSLLSLFLVFWECSYRGRSGAIFLRWVQSTV